MEQTTQNDRRVRVEIDKPPVEISLSFRFQYKSTELADALSQRQLREAGLALQELCNAPGARFQLAGYTDSVGSAEYNRVLSQRRADRIRDLLCDGYQLPSSALTAVGCGKSSPVASNDTDEGRAQNRRVVLRRLD